MDAATIATIQQVIGLLQGLLSAAAPAPTLPLLTPTRLNALKAMQAADGPAWQAIRHVADASKTATPTYDDSGLCAALVYQVTADVSYAGAAWSRLLAYSAMPTAAPYDSVSDAAVEVPLIFSWIKNTGTIDQQKQLLANLAGFANLALGNGGTGGFQPSNANYTIPYYLGLALTDVLTGSSYLGKTSVGGGLSLPVGGLDATAADRKSARNCIADYLRLAAGGVWPEGGNYDTKSVPRLILGWMALQDLLGTDHLPEVAAWVPAACDAALLDFAADFSGVYPWGDRTRLGPDYGRRLSIYAALQAAANRLGDVARTANMGYLLANVLAKFTAATPLWQVDGHFWYFFDPALPIGTRPPDPIVNYSPGVGMMRRADGGSLFAAFSPATLALNHETNGSDVGLYAGGEWVLGAPRGYSLQLDDINLPGQIAGNCFGTNGVAVFGLTKMPRAGLIDHESTADYTYVVGGTSGPIYGPGGPAEFLHEDTRTTFYLPALNAIFVCDRINADNPQVITPGLVGFQSPDAAAIKAAVNWVEQVWHTQTQPNLLAGGKLQTVSWSTLGGQHVQLDAFSTTGPLAVDVVDESVLWAGVSSIDADQKKWQARIRPIANGTWTVIVTVWRLNPTASAPIPLTIGNAAGFSVDGVNVLFGVGHASRLFDPAVITGLPAGKTYLVGCVGAQPVRDAAVRQPEPVAVEFVGGGRPLV